MLADKIAAYRETGKTPMITPARYKTQYIWLREVDSLALTNAQLHLQSAYVNFFSSRSSGFPRFKSKKTIRKKYTTNNQKGSVRIENGKIKLPKVIVQHREIIGIIKSVVIEQTPTSKYYASILTEYESQVSEAALKKFVGLDFSMHDLYVTSKGERANYRRLERKLSRLCRQHSRTKQSSKNREKLRQKMCLVYEKITNQRKDYLHKKSYKLAEEYDTVCVEDLNMRSMSRQMRLGKSVADNSFGKFREMLNYKLYF
ncbi:MAG: transposase [Synergistaceae bacterium]|nr:transposase [Synergistaceae bacterium]